MRADMQADTTEYVVSSTEYGVALHDSSRTSNAPDRVFPFCHHARQSDHSLTPRMLMCYVLPCNFPMACISYCSDTIDTQDKESTRK